MATATFIHDGKAIDYTPGAAVAAGEVVVQNNLVGIAKTPIAADALGALAVEGVFDAAKAAVEIEAGKGVYWDADGDPVTGDAGSGAATTTEDGNVQMGFAVATAADTDETVRVKLQSAAPDNVT
jgi:predicted RecA/RadA family phage recombinase